MKIVELMTKRELNKYAFELIEKDFKERGYALTQEKSNGLSLFIVQPKTMKTSS